MKLLYGSRRTYFHTCAALETMLPPNSKRHAFFNTFLGADLQTCAAADTEVRNPESAHFFRCAIGKRFPVNGIIQQIEPLSVTFIDQESIQDIPGVTGIYFVHARILAKYFIHPLFFNFFNFPVKLQRLTVRTHSAQGDLSRFLQLLIKRFSL